MCVKSEKGRGCTFSMKSYTAHSTLSTIGTYNYNSIPYILESVSVSFSMIELIIDMGTRSC
jgi:hypothetical protein